MDPAQPRQRLRRRAPGDSGAGDVRVLGRGQRRFDGVPLLGAPVRAQLLWQGRPPRAAGAGAHPAYRRPPRQHGRQRARGGAFVRVRRPPGAQPVAHPLGPGVRAAAAGAHQHEAGRGAPGRCLQRGRLGGGARTSCAGGGGPGERALRGEVGPGRARGTRKKFEVSGKAGSTWVPGFSAIILINSTKMISDEKKT